MVHFVGNKNDDPARKVVETNDAQKFAEQMGIQLFETSAKENLNVEEMFNCITELVLRAKKENLAKQQQQQQNDVIKLSKNILQPGRQGYRNKVGEWVGWNVFWKVGVESGLNGLLPHWGFCDSKVLYMRTKILESLQCGNRPFGPTSPHRTSRASHPDPDPDPDPSPYNAPNLHLPEHYGQFSMANPPNL
eukprot:g37547.t1